MDADISADKEARGFAGLAALVSTVSDPAPEAVAPRASSAPRILTGLAGVGIVAMVRLFSSTSAPVAPTPTIPVIVGTGTGTLSPLNLPAPKQPFETRTITLPGSISEVKPPPGTDLWLSSSQILYCLAQQVRLDVMEPMVDTTSAAQLGGFNGLVDDYNTRCLSYRYRNADMGTARLRVEALRPALAMQAKDQVAAWR
jgi:hypothetical protein